MYRPLLLIAAGIPALILLVAVSVDRHRRKQKGERPALSEKLLRPAGYSLQCKLEDLNYDFNFLFMGAFLFALLVIIFPQTRPANVWAPFVSVVIFGLIAAVCAVMAVRKLYQIRAYRRGLIGEQAIAEQLQSLFPLGYQVFHDIPGNGDWNIDHVAVGPAGVFAIETKYRTKKRGAANQRDHEAIFDGTTIQFPYYNDRKIAEQAKINARWLANMLSKATGEQVTAQPIVALPGWLVNRKSDYDLKVLSGKEIFKYVSKERPCLSAESIMRIGYQLDQRCRDVEI